MATETAEFSYIQNALDSARADIAELAELLDGWKEQTDIWERVENWRFNTWRHMEDILRS